VVELGLLASLVDAGDAPLEHVGEGLRVAEAPVEPIERSEQLGGVARVLDGLGVGVDGRGVVLELLLGDAAEAEEEVRRDGRVEDARGALRRACRRSDRSRAVFGEALDLLVEEASSGRVFEGAEERGSRRLPGASPRRRHGWRWRAATRAIGGLALRAEAQLEHGDEIVVATRRAEHGLQASAASRRSSSWASPMASRTASIAWLAFTASSSRTRRYCSIASLGRVELARVEIADVACAA
jgi:hypothetical protein